MNWDALGALGEVMGAIAVFITLIYLATQIKHARAETHRAVSQARNESNRELIALGLQDKILEAHIKAEMAFAPDSSEPLEMLMAKAALSREEAIRVLMVFVAYWNYVVQIVSVIDVLSVAERQHFDQFVRNRFRRPGTYGELYQVWIRLNAEGSSVVAYVDGILEGN